MQKTCGIVQISVKYTKFGRDIKVNTLSISGDERWIQISVYYEQHLIEQHQLALSKFSSKTVALLKVVDSWKFVIDDGLKSVCVFLDLRKACGVIMHDILLAKLESYGIKGNALRWVNSYLLGRSQFVVCSDSGSELRHLPFGVPQWSVLGPTLFNSGAPRARDARVGGAP